MQILKPYYRPTESESLRMGSKNLCLNTVSYSYLCPMWNSMSAVAFRIYLATRKLKTLSLWIFPKVTVRSTHLYSIPPYHSLPPCFLPPIETYCFLGTNILGFFYIKILLTLVSFIVHISWKQSEIHYIVKWRYK